MSAVPVPEIPESAVRRLAAHFEPDVVEAAVNHVRRGRVHIVKPPPWPVVARVHDDEGQVVTVAFGPAGHLRSECSCAVGEGCAHAAAAALLVFTREGEYKERQAEAARQSVVGDWLAELGRQEAHPTAALGAEQLVAYVLDVKDGEAGLTVVQCARQRRGGLSTGVPIASLADPMRGAPRWVDIDDLRRIAMLRAVTRALPQVTRLPVARLHTELLEELAGTGRLFFESTRGQPLAYGLPVKERLAWRAVDEPAGAFRLGIDPALIVVAAREPHYLDPGGALLGPLELGVPAELVQRLVTGPPVPASMRRTVERSLAPLLVGARAASDEAPDAPDVVEIAAPGTPMRPRLHAAVAEDEPSLRLLAEAAYDDERFPLAEWDAERPYDRDLVAEGRARARLRTLLADLPHGGKPSTSLELLADARGVAEQLVPRLRHEGWEVTLADDFPHEAPLDEAAITWVERLRPLSERHGWFALELGVVVAGRTVPLLPILLEAIKDGQLVLAPDGSAVHRGAGFNLRLPEGELVYVPAERVARWLGPLVELELAGLDAAGELKLPAYVAARWGDPRGTAPGRFAGAAELDAARERLAALLSLEPRLEAPGFAGTLRPYQRTGHAWLRFLHDSGYGGLLADEMGLGKTVQVLAFLDGLRAEGRLGAAAPALVVAPRSLVGNWEREAARFTPGLAAAVHLGAGRAEDAAGLCRTPLVITSYQTLVRDASAFAEVTWSSVLFDEAQALKNPDTQVRAVAGTLRAQSRFCITGTPLENHLGELWSELDLVVPGLVGRRRSFDAFFRRPVERYGKSEPLELLRQRIRPFLLRRAKDAVELDLPPRTEIVESVELDTPQRDLYETLRLRLDKKIRAALAAKGIAGASMLILDAMLKLRQCCCDPRLLRLAEARRVAGSAKLERLLDMLTELADSGRTTIVFSQFTGMLALIEEACAKAGLATLSLTGETRDRDAVVRRFQAGEVPVLLASLKAGGVGLNLTRADTVIHYDPWWNPAVEAQASARAHRIGQEKPVMVYKLVARGTLEEAIGKMQEEKRVLTEAALQDGGLTHLAPADLETLYRSIV